ncbi:hypothetical protein [Candidatus Entotheonella palauensis]|uniref:Uncharacterized protein n=1 Tax=Candidatus Entotheonella gemina TaxID=1429439 RepID=W4LZM6_9BACT|nr:hypothetical protein [Candidatus Entotheonella palauensis]ETX02827.1 MAG: hypothetical protein ETSY2_34765 [Candidatus Entotheonella gemina]
MNLFKKAVGLLIVMAIAMGVKFWNKSSAYEDAKAQMLEFCGGVAKCEAALSEKFDTCFDSSYDLGSKRHSGGLDHTTFVQCINSKDGSEILTLNH